ncbi:hypothetical protein KCH_32160 [Kitasatospora cheerisanensis KCTC 2395]|uniref:Uncharacterized protein n=1 Tax=Kitasatospora cheerisanensis KCTC 2395 TaxID=1348663 RepID=A0A066YV69_9ACTN|nr:hypothetical protein KCH_32160 [Kitasatospora cheerisanensis KCTC 2395]
MIRRRRHGAPVRRGPPRCQGDSARSNAADRTRPSGSGAAATSSQRRPAAPSARCTACTARCRWPVSRKVCWTRRVWTRSAKSANAAGRGSSPTTAGSGRAGASGCGARFSGRGAAVADGASVGGAAGACCARFSGRVGAGDGASVGGGVGACSAASGCRGAGRAPSFCGGSAAGGASGAAGAASVAATAAASSWLRTPSLRMARLRWARAVPGAMPRWRARVRRSSPAASRASAWASRGERRRSSRSASARDRDGLPVVRSGSAVEGEVTAFLRCESIPEKGTCTDNPGHGEGLRVDTPQGVALAA